MPKSPLSARSFPRLGSTLSAAALTASTALVCGCPTTTGSAAEPFAESRGTSDIALAIYDDAILVEAAAFVDDANALSAATEAWSSSPADTGARAEARKSFNKAMRRWQRLEVMQVGPLALPKSTTVQGEGLRDELYSWPMTSPCEVDRNIASEAFAGPQFINQKLVNAYGLDAAEYLLFVDTDDNACPSPASLNTSGDWSSLNTDDILRRRAAYADVVAQHVAATAADVDRRLNDFRAQIAEAGTDVSGYASATDVLQAYLDAMFYLEFDTKDKKLGVTTGIHEDCIRDTCTDSIELRHASLSISAIADNVEGFELMFNGGSTAADDKGIAGLLTLQGDEQLRDRIRNNISAAKIHLAEHESTDLFTLIENDLDEARALHASVKAITDDLKGDLVMALMLVIPAEGGGDTD